MRQDWAKLASEKKHFWVRKNPVDAKLAQNLPDASPRGWDMRMLRGCCVNKVASWGQEAFQEPSGMQKWPPTASKMTQNRPQNDLESNTKWPPKDPISISILICLFQICNTPTHLTSHSHRTTRSDIHLWLTQRSPKNTEFGCMDFSLQHPRYAYADLRHRMCGAGVYACVFNNKTL